MSIHPSAVIDPGAELGRDVTVGPFTFVDRDVRIGDGCRIGPHVTILRHTSVGPGCSVHAGAVRGDLPQDLGFKDAVSYVSIGAGCRIREGVTIHRGTKPETTTEVGDQCFLMAFSHCAHNVKLGQGVILANGALLGGYVEIGDRAFISGNCLIHQFTRIGRIAMLSGGGGVSKDVPPFCTVRSLTVNSVAGLNVVGMRRGGISPEERLEIKKAFAIVYRSGLNVTQAVARIREAFAKGPALEFADFIEASKRGVCRFGGDAAAEEEE